MGFLAPVLLMAAVAVAVPLLLHLFHRHDTRRLSFPAIRYLLRTEKEHARRIRFRQLILLFLRIAVILLVVLAGARLFVRGSGSGHDPTAVALVLDNSMSSGLVIGEERALDVLERLALETVGRATADDQIWVIRVGEPWDVAPPVGPAEAAERIRSTEVSSASGNVSAALTRARELLLASPLPAREIHLLSDLQLTAFRQGDAQPAGDIPVILYHAGVELPNNRYLHDVLVGGGLAPLAGQRTEIAVSLGATDLSDREEVPLRLVVGDQIRGASSTQPGRVVALPIGPLEEGFVYGYIESDPDALSADDRRPFAFRVRPPPVVAVVGEAFFLEQALTVLEEGGRLRRGPAAGADVLLSVGGAGLEGRRAGQVAVVFPPSDATLLPAMNLRLAQAGIPWRVEREGSAGEAQIQDNRLPVDLTGVRVLQRYDIGSTGQGDTADVSVTLSTGQPWIVTGATQNAYVLVGSPLEPESTTLPVSAAMVPLLEWMTTVGSSAASAGSRVEAGQPLGLPPSATHLRLPDGSTRAVDGTADFRETREAGLYTVLRGEAVLEHVAVGAPVRESLLAPLGEDAFEDRIGTELHTAEDLDEWGREIFVTRQGPELWKPLLVTAFVLLLVEAWVAAGGASAGARTRSPQGEPDEGRREIGVTAS